MEKHKKYENVRIKNRIRKIDKVAMDIVTLIGINNIVPQENYNDKLKILGVELCVEARDYGCFCTQDYEIRKEQFERYKWHIENVSVTESDMLKILGDVYKMIDNDDYYFKTKKEIKHRV